MTAVARAWVAARETVAVLRLVPVVDRWRRHRSVHGAVALARGEGTRRGARGPAGRVRLRRVIAAVDRRLPGGRNCVRRALLEMALDAGAANERLLAGLQMGGQPGSGHAWLESDAADRHYDAVIRI